MKQCNTCGDNKPLDQFPKARSTRDGLSGKCKGCTSEYQRQWRRNNPEYMRNYRKQIPAGKYKNPRQSQFLQARYNLRKYRGMTECDLEISFGYRDAIELDPCRYCGVSDNRTEYQIDHYVPVSFPHHPQGMTGTDVWYNLTRSCKSCNTRKSNHCGTWMLLQ